MGREDYDLNVSHLLSLTYRRYEMRNSVVRARDVTQYDNVMSRWYERWPIQQRFYKYQYFYNNLYNDRTKFEADRTKIGAFFIGTKTDLLILPYEKIS